LRVTSRGLGDVYKRQEWLSKLTFGIGFLLVAFTPKKRALHDLLARTQVVFDRRGRR
jgi:uncharacterized RDD family membrane protein YckC